MFSQSQGVFPPKGHTTPKAEFLESSIAQAPGGFKENYPIFLRKTTKY
jgi:hypothetical protein